MGSTFNKIFKIGTLISNPKVTIVFLIPASHSYPNYRFITHDLHAYRIKRWRKVINSELEIIDTLTPCLYPYPDFIQWFPKRTWKGVSSSVFFICKKKS